MRLPEQWIFDFIHGLLEDESTLDATVEKLRRVAEEDLTPAQEAWTATQKALHRNEAQINEIVSAIASGKVQDALWEVLNARAAQLKLERARLMVEQQQWKDALGLG